MYFSGQCLLLVLDSFFATELGDIFSMVHFVDGEKSVESRLSYMLSLGSPYKVMLGNHLGSNMLSDTPYRSFTHEGESLIYEYDCSLDVFKESDSFEPILATEHYLDLIYPYFADEHDSILESVDYAYFKNHKLLSSPYLANAGNIKALDEGFFECHGLYSDSLSKTFFFLLPNKNLAKPYLFSQPESGAFPLEDRSDTFLRMAYPLVLNFLNDIRSYCIEHGIWSHRPFSLKRKSLSSGRHPTALERMEFLKNMNLPYKVFKGDLRRSEDLNIESCYDYFLDHNNDPSFETLLDADLFWQKKSFLDLDGAFVDFNLLSNYLFYVRHTYASDQRIKTNDLLNIVFEHPGFSAHGGAVSATNEGLLRKDAGHFLATMNKDLFEYHAFYINDPALYSLGRTVVFALPNFALFSETVKSITGQEGISSNLSLATLAERVRFSSRCDWKGDVV